MNETYYIAGAPDKAEELTGRFIPQLMKSALFFYDYFDYARSEFERCYNCIQFVADLAQEYGDENLAEQIRTDFDKAFGLDEEE